MTEFDSVMELTPVAGAGERRRASLGEGWVIGAGINGGVLMALGARAMAGAVRAAGGGGDTLAFSAYFLSASAPGPADLDVEVLRVGRSFSTAQVAITQPTADGGSAERVRMLSTVADLAAVSGPLHRQQAPPAMPEPDACLPASAGPREILDPIKILHRLDLRLDPATAGFGLGVPTGRGELRAWIRFADGREPDLGSLPFFLDALPPVSFDLGAMGWAPTIEFSGHLRAHPAPGWLRTRITTSNVTGGLLEEDCVIWDATDRVVAQSRQLAGVRMPPAP